MDLREALLVAGLSLLVLAAVLHLQAGGSSSTPAAAHPEEGEAGRYAVEHVLSTSNGSRETHTQTWVRSWTTEELVLPSGEERSLPTLTLRLVDEDEEAQAARPAAAPPWIPMQDEALATGTTAGSGPDPSLHELSFSYTRLPGPAATMRTAVLVDDDEHGDVHEFRRTRTDLSPCQGARVGFVVGQPAEEAEQGLVSCLLDHVEGPVTSTDVDADWAKHPRYGRTWTLNASVEHRPEDQPTTTSLGIRTSSQASLPLERTYTVTKIREEGNLTESWTARLTGWTDGAQRLPDERPPIEPGPSLDLVPWTDKGPREGRLGTLAFDEARQHAREDEDVQRFHERHEEARLYAARYVERHSSEHSREPTARADERGCSTSPGEGPALPSRDGRATPSWELQWAGEGEHLESAIAQHASLDSSPTGTSQGLVTTDSHTWPTDRQPPGLGLPALAPSPEALFEQLDVADRIGAEGDPFFEIHRPWDGGRVLDAEVGRTRCAVDPATGAYTSWTEGIGFEDGRAVSLFQVAFETEGQPPAALASAELPGDEDSRDDDAIPAGPIGWAGAALAATGLTTVASRGLGTLYSRFTSEDVLDSSQRQALYDSIQEGMGATLSELADAHDMHPSSVDHHVTMLERHGLVEVTRTPAGAIAHPVGHPATRHAEVLAREGSRRTLRLLAEEGPIDTVSALGDRLEVSTSQASRVATRLEEAGLLDRQPEGRSNRLVLSETGRRLVQA